jgi:hypothetical protein
MTEVQSRGFYRVSWRFVVLNQSVPHCFVQSLLFTFPEVAELKSGAWLEAVKVLARKCLTELGILTSRSAVRPRAASVEVDLLKIVVQNDRALRANEPVNLLELVCEESVANVELLDTAAILVVAAPTSNNVKGGSITVDSAIEGFTPREFSLSSSTGGTGRHHFCCFFDDVRSACVAPVKGGTRLLFVFAVRVDVGERRRRTFGDIVHRRQQIVSEFTRAVSRLHDTFLNQGFLAPFQLYGIYDRFKVPSFNAVSAAAQRNHESASMIEKEDKRLLELIQHVQKVLEKEKKPLSVFLCGITRTGYVGHGAPDEVVEVDVWPCLRVEDGSRFHPYACLTLDHKILKVEFDSTISWNKVLCLITNVFQNTIFCLFMFV